MIDYCEMIAALTTDYHNVYVIEPENNIGTTIKLNGRIMDSLASAPDTFDYEEFMADYLKTRVYEKDRERIALASSIPALIDAFSTGSERNELNYRVVDKDGSIHYLRILYIRISKPGELLRLVAGARNIDYKINRQKEIHTEGLNHAYSAIAGIYLSMYRVNIKTNTYTVIKTTDTVMLYPRPDSEFFEENAKSFIKELCTEENYPSMLKFLNRDTLDQRMYGKSHISAKFDGKTGKTYRLHYIREGEDDTVPIKYMIVALEALESNDYRSVFDTLARNFQNVFWVDLQDGTAKILKLDGYITKGLDKNNHSSFSYPAILKQYISERVYDEDKQMLYNKLCLDHLKEIFESSDEYIGNYRVFVDGEMHNYQFNYSTVNGTSLIVCGFQNIDDIIREHLEEEKKKREQEEAYQQELIAAKDEANRANTAKTDFLLRMSHDIRTPINGIMGLLDIADMCSDDLEKQNECRQKLRSTSKLLLDLINEVLDMGKLESGEILLEHIPFDLNEISTDIHDTVKKLADERNIEIIEEDCEAYENQLIGSPVHLKRLMLNIVGNAIKYNKDNGKVFITRHVHNVDEKNVNLEFKCRDTGIGMSEEFLERIFEPFSQETTTARSKYGGTGLGMSIAKNLIDKMGGSISVESIKGQGSTFSVILPFEIVVSENENNKCIDASTDFSIEGMHILLVEDNELNMEIAKFLLEENGAEITECWNGKEAVKVFKDSPAGTFDAILMDVRMPVMNGYEATRIIRNLDHDDAKDIPIIAMTANAFVEDKIAVKKAGMNRHIAKPFDIQAVIRAISELAGAKNDT